MTDDIKWALTEFASRRNSYTLARNYYDGNHRLAFASEKLQSAFGRLFKAFADNLCPCVCETVKDRLKLDGFTVPQGQDVRPSIDEIWRRNRLKVRANEVHLDSLIEGDGYLIIWPDKEDFPTFYPNRATAIVTEYDDEQPGYITRAAKAWTVENKSRLTLYFRDRIEKYITREKVHGGLPDRAEAFIRFEAEGEPWPIKNNYDKVPVFHFGNRTGIGSLGISELQEAIPVQDALNKSIADMLVASEFYGVPQRWAIGLEDDLTLAEAKKKYPLLAGGVWGSTSKDIKFGQFEPSDVSHYLSIIDGFRKEIARVSRTPLHFFSLEGTYPSGESLKTAEAPLTAKINDKSEAWGGVWSDAMRFALQIAGKGEYEPEAKWLNTETRNEGEQIKQASTKVKDLGIPQEVVWSELGYSEKQIQDMQNAVQSEESEPKEEERTNGQSEVIA